MNFFKVEIFFTLSLSCLYWLSLLPASTAQQAQLDAFDREEVVFIPAKKRQDPPSRGTPESDFGAGSRGTCPYRQEMTPLTSLVGDKALTSTIDPHPSFWVYIPYSTEDISEGRFILQDNNDNDLYRARVSLPTDIPGIVEIKLPKTSKPLQVGEAYRWYLEIDCSQGKKQSDDSSSSFATLTGIVCLVEPSSQLERELTSAQNSFERVKIFAKYGIWYDALAQLVQLRSQDTSSSNSEKLWQSLLGQSEVGKTEVIDKTLAGKADLLPSEN